MNFQVLPMNTPTFSVDLHDGLVSRCIGLVVEEWDGGGYNTRPISEDGFVFGVVGEEYELVSSLKEGSMLFKDVAARYKKIYGGDIRDLCKEVGCPIIKYERNRKK